jgi:integrase
MRLDEIFRVTWGDLNEEAKLLTIRDRKDPRLKRGNDQEIPLLSLTGLDAFAIIQEQRPDHLHPDGRIFPYGKRTATAAFARACNKLGIEDLRFHDLRHEGTSRLIVARPVENRAGLALL